jgi:TPP-dependent 2-oxoacid decarboxylase
MRFPNSEIVNITSHDCKKSIPLINNNGYVVLPHMLFEDYNDIKKVVQHCQNYLTLLRYFDLREISRFLTLVNEDNYIP